MASEKPRNKRTAQELDEDEYGEGGDTFDTDNSCAPRRGAKEMKRISGVYREIKALQDIGRNATVMELIFSRLPLKEVMDAGSVYSKWYTTAIYVLRKRNGNAPVVRLWNSNALPKYLLINWELHFHEQLLAGDDQDDSMEVDNHSTFPSVDTIISIGSRYSFDLFTHEDAKLPFRQDHIFLTCNQAVITTPDFSATGTVDDTFGTTTPLVVQSIFIPKSKHFTIKAFGLESNRESWELDQVTSKIELPADDVGPGQDLRAILCAHYFHNGATMGFVEHIRKQYPTVGLLSGFAEEVGTNRVGATDLPSAVGLSIYAGPGANVSIYEVDFEVETSVNILNKMEEQVKSAPNGLCFLFTRDTRNWTQVKDEDANDQQDWSYEVRPPCRKNEILQLVRAKLQKTPIFGVDSHPSILAEPIDKNNSNVPEGSKRGLCYGFLLLTYQ